MRNIIIIISCFATNSPIPVASIISSSKAQMNSDFCVRLFRQYTCPMFLNIDKPDGRCSIESQLQPRWFLWRSRGQKVKGRFQQIPPKLSDVCEVNAIPARSSGCQWIRCQFGQVLRFTQTALTFRRVGVAGVTGKASILPNGLGCGEAQAHGMGWFLEQKGQKANG